MMDWTRNALLAAATGGMLALGGCAGADLQIDAPILEAAGIQLTSKKGEDDAPEHSGLVMPPTTESLPQPGTQTAAVKPNEQNWPQDPDKLRKRKAEEEAAAREAYCRDGKWKDKADINEFNKDAGQEARCPSKLGETIAKNLNSKPSPSGSLGQ
ncbi:MAG: hypothetical protein HC850_06295 [Rhodomicrobium sp.]|nr:hypothetical protein [Rhodomicrobium sp.]